MTDSRHRRCLRSLCAAALLAGLAPALLPQTTQAQQGQAAYPNRPIRAVVPSPPGGPPDLTLRILTPKLSALLGQPVVVENRGGAGGIVGTGYVARQPADGYTWLFTTASHANTPPFNENVPFNPIRDFTHVTLAVQNFGQALVVPVSLKVNSVAELIELAKKNPGKLTYVKGGAETNAAVLGGHTMLQADSTGWRSLVDSGQLRLLVLWTEKRSKFWPDVPTLKDVGIDFVFDSPWGIAGPKGMDPAVVKRLDQAFKKALEDKKVVEILDSFVFPVRYADQAGYLKIIEEVTKSEKEGLEKIGQAK